MSKLHWEVIDPNWETSVEKPTAVLVGHRVYFCASLSGGAYGCVYDLNTKTWRAFESELESKDYHATALVEDKIYLYGGTSVEEETTGEMAILDLMYDTVEEIKTFKQGPGKRIGMSTLWVPWLGEIVYFGGYIKKKNLRFNEVLAFSVTNRSWRKVTMKGEAPPPRTGHSTLGVGTNMYVYGGYAGPDEYLGDLHIANLKVRSGGSWSSPWITGRIPACRTLPELNKLGRFLILFGGYYPNAADVELSVEVYLPEAEKWATGYSMDGTLPTKARNQFSVQVWGGIVYFTVSGIYKLWVEE